MSKMGIDRKIILRKRGNGFLKLQNMRSIALRKTFMEIKPHFCGRVNVDYTNFNFSRKRL